MFEPSSKSCLAAFLVLMISPCRRAMGLPIVSIVAPTASRREQHRKAMGFRSLRKLRFKRFKRAGVNLLLPPTQRGHGILSVARLALQHDSIECDHQPHAVHRNGYRISRLLHRLNNLQGRLDGFEVSSPLDAACQASWRLAVVRMCVELVNCYTKGLSKCKPHSFERISPAHRYSTLLSHLARAWQLHHRRSRSCLGWGDVNSFLISFFAVQCSLATEYSTTVPGLSAAASSEL